MASDMNVSAFITADSSGLKTGMDEAAEAVKNASEEITNASEKAASSFAKAEELKSESAKKSVVIISSATNEMAAAMNASLNKINADTKRMAEGMQETAAKTKASFAAMEKGAEVLRGVAAAFAAEKVIEYSDAWTTVSNKLANVVKQDETLSQVRQRVFDLSQKTNSSLEATAILYGRLEPATKNLVSSGDELGRIVETINKAMAVGGATAEESKNALIQLSQAMGEGVLRGQDFLSVNEQAPRLMQMVADGMGITRGELRAYAEQGKITSDAVINAVKTQAAAIDAEFSKMDTTFQQKGVKAWNNVIQAIGNNSDLKSAISSAGDEMVGLSNHVDLLVKAGEAVLAVYGSKMATEMANTTAKNAGLKLAFRESAIAEKEVAAATLEVATQNKAAAITAQLYAAEQLAASASDVERISNQQKLTIAIGATIAAEATEIEATQAYTVAQTEAAAATDAAVIAKNALQGALGLIGGPLGAASLAALAIFTFTQESERGKEAAIDFANKTDVLTGALKRMSAAQAEAADAKLEQALKAQSNSVEDLQNKISSMKSDLDQYSYWTKEQKQQSSELKQKEQELAIAVADLELKENELSQTRNKMFAVTQSLNGELRDNYVLMQASDKEAGISVGIQRELNDVLGIQLDTKKKLNLVETDKPSITDKEKEYLKKLDQENEQLKVQGAERARLKAYQDAIDQGMSKTTASAAGQKAANNYSLEESQKPHHGGPSASSSLEAELSAKKLAYEQEQAAEGSYHEFSKQQELAFWESKLATVKKGSAEETQIQQKISQEKLAINKQVFQAELEELKTQIAENKNNVQVRSQLVDQYLAKVKKAYGEESAEYKKALKEKVTLQREATDEQIKILDSETNKKVSALSSEEEIAKAEADARGATEMDQLAITEQFEQRKYQLKQQALQKELQLEQQENNPAKMQETYNKMIQLNSEYQAKCRLNAIARWKAEHEYMATTISSLQSGMAQAMQGLMSKTTTMSGALKTMATSVGQGVDQMLAEAASKWVSNKITEMAMGKVSATSEIGANAATAGSAAWASTAAIPVVGPAMAPAAAASAYTGAMSFAASIPAAAKGFDIPAGINPLTQLHEKEMVLPANIAQPLRDNLSNGGGFGGGDTHLHVHAVDADSVRRLFEHNGSALVNALKKQKRNFAG